MAFRDSFERCPRCAITLEDAASARGCRNCGGVFLDGSVLGEMILRMLPPPPRELFGPLALSEVIRSGQALACPSCGTAMTPTTIHDVELDHCEKHGVWFDQDELQMTLFRVADPANPPPFRELVPPPLPWEQPLPPSPGEKIEAGAPELVFHLIHGGQIVRKVKRQLGVLKIGRLQTAHLMLADPDVSRLHAIIEATHEGVTLIDLGSDSGSFVNDERVAKRRLLPGDTLRFGKTVLRLASIT